MKGHKVGYVRVSSIDQNIGRQLEGIEVDRLFVDKASGKIQPVLNFRKCSAMSVKVT